MVYCWQYVFDFTAKERLRIRREDDLQECRTLIGIVVGVLTTVAVFLSAWPWTGGPHLATAYAAYGCIPAGLLAGAWVRHRIPHYVHRRWMTVWHPILVSRREPKGLETLTPPAPLTFIELLDRRYLGLDQSGCALLVMPLGYLLLFLIQPVAATTTPSLWLWGLVFLTWFPFGLLVSEQFYERLSPQAPERASR